MTNDTIRSVHKLRRAARIVENDMQDVLDRDDPIERKALGVPDWARGVKVERAGLFQHAVMFTTNKGH